MKKFLRLCGCLLVSAQAWAGDEAVVPAAPEKTTIEQIAALIDTAQIETMGRVFSQIRGKEITVAITAKDKAYYAKMSINGTPYDTIVIEFPRSSAPDEARKPELQIAYLLPPTTGNPQGRKVEQITGRIYTLHPMTVTLLDGSRSITAWRIQVASDEQIYNALTARTALPAPKTPAPPVAKTSAATAGAIIVLPDEVAPPAPTAAAMAPTGAIIVLPDEVVPPAPEKITVEQLTAVLDTVRVNEGLRDLLPQIIGKELTVEMTEKNRTANGKAAKDGVFYDTVVATFSRYQAKDEAPKRDLRVACIFPSNDGNVKHDGKEIAGRICAVSSYPNGWRVQIAADEEIYELFAASVNKAAAANGSAAAPDAGTKATAVAAPKPENITVKHLGMLLDTMRVREDFANVFRQIKGKKINFQITKDNKVFYRKFYWRGGKSSTVYDTVEVEFSRYNAKDKAPHRDFEIALVLSSPLNGNTINPNGKTITGRILSANSADLSCPRIFIAPDELYATFTAPPPAPATIKEETVAAAPEPEKLTLERLGTLLDTGRTATDLYHISAQLQGQEITFKLPDKSLVSEGRWGDVYDALVIKFPRYNMKDQTPNRSFIVYYFMPYVDGITVRPKGKEITGRICGIYLGSYFTGRTPLLFITADEKIYSKYVAHVEQDRKYNITSDNALRKLPYSGN